MDAGLFRPAKGVKVPSSTICRRRLAPNNITIMDNSDEKLRNLLRAAKPSPDLPPGFQPGVWRRIESAEASSRPESWLEQLTALIFRPRYAVAWASVLVVTGILLGTHMGSESARHAAQMRYLQSVAPEFIH